jgi:nicotinamide mononucleotide transporter
MSWTEVLGVATGAACVLLAIRELVWTWPVGLANNIFFFVLFWRAKLYADSSLQVVYMAISLYGWWNWLYGGKGRSKLKVARTTAQEAAGLAFAAAAATATIYLILRSFTDSNVPLGDATTTALSLTAQYMVSRKHLENWFVWITADVIYIGLYIYKGLYLTTALYAGFIVMCVMGWIQWRRSWRTAKVEEAAAG